jgi:N-acetylmuramoyl-L-alanine amidase
MFSSRHSLLFVVVSLLFVNISCVAPHQSLASPTQNFQTGWKKFHRLCKTPSQAKYRSYWLQIKKYFLTAYQNDPHGPYAPKSLYYLGRTYQELGKRSYLKKDFLKSVDYFQRVVLQFPDHSWSDDAKLYRAKVYLNHLENPDQAYLELLSILHNYPNGDMYQKAKKLIGKIDKKNTQTLSDQIKTSQRACRQNRPSDHQIDKSASSLQGLKKLNTIRHWSSDEYTRVVLDLNTSTEFHHFLLKPDPKLKKPHRLVVDLDQTMVCPKLSESLKIDDGILRQVRAAQNTHKKVRVVLDVQKLDTYRVFSLENPYRVVIDVYAPDRDKKILTKKEAKNRSEHKQTGKTQEGSVSLIKQLGLNIETVMIDPGHGGKDPGAVWGKLYEKDINLRMATILGKILKDRGLKVLYTRTTDVFIPLEERTALANSNKVDLFISLHVNAHRRHSIQGFEIYYLNLAQSKDAVRVAARENAVSTKKISDLQVILTDLMLNSKIEESHNLAETVLDETLEYNDTFYSVHNNGVRRAPFYVLMGAKMPAVLVELGYLTNAQERKRLKSYAYLKRMAWGIANGIMSYKKEIQKFASFSKTTQTF